MQRQEELLIVDPDSTTRDRVAYVLQKKTNLYRMIYTAENADRAERALELHEITHIICEFDFEPSYPTGTTLIQNWRWKYPSITKTVILTDTILDKSWIPSEVDYVLSKKSARIGTLIAALRNDKPTVHRQETKSL